MHELAITQNMLDLVLEQAKKIGAERVGKINLVIGEMSGIVDGNQAWCLSNSRHAGRRPAA